MIHIKLTQEFGRGVYASQDINCGELVELCELLVFSPDDTIKVNETDLKWYTFKYDETRDCLCLGNGEIFNHSDDANIDFQLVTGLDGIKRMMFVANRDIKQGEKLFINYSSDVTVDSKQYTTNMI